MSPERDGCTGGICSRAGTCAPAPCAARHAAKTEPITMCIIYVSIEVRVRGEHSAPAVALGGSVGVAIAIFVVDAEWRPAVAIQPNAAAVRVRVVGAAGQSDATSVILQRRTVDDLDVERTNDALGIGDLTAG